MIIKTISSSARNAETVLYRNGFCNFAKKRYYHQQQHAKRNHHHETHFTFPRTNTIQRTKASSDDAEVTESEDAKEEKTFTETFESFFAEKEESISEKEKRLNDERKKELEMKQRVYDRDGTYVSEEGSDFFKDPEQIKAVGIFCAFLASFLSLGNIGAAFLLPIIYGKPLQSCIGGIVFGLPCPGIDF